MITGSVNGQPTSGGKLSSTNRGAETAPRRPMNHIDGSDSSCHGTIDNVNSAASASGTARHGKQAVAENASLVAEEPATTNDESATAENNPASRLVSTHHRYISVDGHINPKYRHMLNDLFNGKPRRQTIDEKSNPIKDITPIVKPTFSDSFLEDTIPSRKKVQDRLTIDRLSQIIRPDSAILAYLSACSSAATTEKTLADESLHIASEFLTLGFTHVIGTLWETNSDCCAEVAQQFYQRWLGKMERELVSLDAYHVAEALHDAVLALNESGIKPLHWAPFIHMGA
jgi:hypothetical protein